MRTLIIVSSQYMGNTMKVAKAIADELKATVITPNEIDKYDTNLFDLIGFGSGIKFASLNKEIMNSIGKINIENKKVFIFTTRCRPILGGYHSQAKSLIISKKWLLAGEFSCAGYDRTGPWIGMNGYNKNRPNDNDLFNAKLFAMHIRRKAHPLADFKKMYKSLSTFSNLEYRTDGINNVVGSIAMLNMSACISCGQCIKTCPLSVYSMSGNITTPLPSGEINCIMCGKCQKGCPSDAIFINETFRNGLRILFRETKLQKLYWSK